jgi:hypothetical protein
VDSCAACAETVRRLRAERRLLERAAAPEVPLGPPAALLKLLPRTRSARPRFRAKLSLAGLAAAATLLATLAWVLTRAPRPDNAGVASSSQPRDPLDRLIEELRSPIALRREIATMALRSYGGAAVERLTKAKADPAVIDACRNVTPEMRAIEKKLQTLKIDLAFENTKIEDILAFLRDFSGLNLLIDAAVREKIDPGEPVTIKVQGTPVAAALQRICEPKGLKYVVTPELVVLLTDKDRGEPEGLAPLRIPGAQRVPADEIDALGSDSPDTRDRATLDLRRMGFAAEIALWGALNGPNVERRARAADLLRALYTVGTSFPRGPLEEKLHKTRVTIDMQNAPMTALVDYLAEVTRISIVIDNAGLADFGESMISFKVADIVVDGALRLMLGPRQMTYVVVGDVVLITSGQRVLSSSPPPYWMAPAEARRIEGLLEDLASDIPERHATAERVFREIGEPALGPLGEASRVLDGPAGDRCRSARLKLLEELKGWVSDEPSGADLQALTAVQRELLARPVTLPAKPKLKDVVADLGVKATFKAGGDFSVQGALNKVRLDSVLRGLLRPSRLDFYMEGETIVVDTAANVRAALKK